MTGKVEQTIGMATGDAPHRGAGLAREVGGKGQNLYGQASKGSDDVMTRTSGMYDDIRHNLDGSLRPARRQVERMPHALLLVVVGAAGHALGFLSSGGRR